MKALEERRHAVGVDLGGSKIGLGIVDDQGSVSLHRYLKTEAHAGAAAIQRAIMSAIRSLLREVEVPVAGIGIGVAGQVNPQTGEVIFAPNLAWHHIPIRFNLQQEFNLPVMVMNDVRAITLGEWLYGAGQGAEDLLCVFIGTGIGGGVVSGGRLLMGCSNTFGEIGHMTVDLHGPRCRCGKLGCMEVYAAGWGIAARIQELVASDPQGAAAESLLDLAGHQLLQLTAEVVAHAARKGNPLAVRILKQSERALVAGIASLVNAFNPSRLILGGGIIEGMPELLAAIKIGVPSEALKGATEHLSIVKAGLGKEAGLIGAAAALLNQLIG